MKKTDKIAYQQNSREELQKSLVDLKKEFVESKAKHASGNVKDTSVFKKIQYKIALVSTLIKEKENEQNK